MIVATYKTKKVLQESVGEKLEYKETSLFSTEYQSNGTFAVVGPLENNRKWYAAVTMENDKIAKVE